MITFSENQQKIVNALEAVNCARWIDNHNGTISCSYCDTWVYKDNRYSYFRYCPYCGKKMEDKQAIDTTVKDTKAMGNTNDCYYDRKTIKGADFEKALNRLSECVKRTSNDNFIGDSGQDKEVNTIEIPKNVTDGDMIKAMFPSYTCKNCKHRPVDDSGSIEPPYDVENRRLDETCPCINKADWRYSYVPEDDFFCAYVEKKSVTPVHKKSKWIFTKAILDKYGSTVECPSCHKKWKTCDEIRFEKENKYCPNCGEEMESKE